MKRSKFLALLLAVLLVAGLAAGCGSPSSNEETEKEDFSNKTLEIAIFEGGMGAKQWQRIADAFEEKHPGLKITLTASPKIGEILLPRIIAGNSPDFIVMMDENTSGLMETMIQKRLLTDLTEVFNGPCYDRDEPLREQILPGYLDNRKYMPYDDGHIYLAPQDSGPRGLVYNSALFEQKGWKVPETWEEFFALGDVAKQEGRSLFTYPGIYAKYLANFLIPAIANHAGEDAVEDIFNYKKHSFDSPEVLEVLWQFEHIYSGGYLLPNSLAFSHLQAQQAVLDGQALFIPTGPWVEQEMQGAKREDGFRFGMTYAPGFEGDEKKYITANYGQACIPLVAKNPDVAKEFLRFLYTDEAVALYAEGANSVLAVKEGREISREFISEDLYNMFSVFSEATPILNDFAVPPVTSVMTVKDTLYTDGATKLFSGQITAVEWAQNMERLFAQIREEYNLSE